MRGYKVDKLRDIKPGYILPGVMLTVIGIVINKIVIHFKKVGKAASLKKCHHSLELCLSTAEGYFKIKFVIKCHNNLPSVYFRVKYSTG